MIEKIKTGMPKLDEALYGGFEKNASILLFGEAGTGKSSIGIQYLYKGYEQGDNGLYVTFEEPTNSYGHK
jgi:KaiC/GvpD/RAD55 family RecA-like ATPase